MKKISKKSLFTNLVASVYNSYICWDSYAY